MLVILQFFPKFSTISPGVAMLPLLVVLAITALKDGYEDVKRHQSDRHINLLKVKTLIGGGWTNPNVMEAKERSFASALRSFKNTYLGGKKRQSEKLAHNGRLTSQSRLSLSSAADPAGFVPLPSGAGGAPLAQTQSRADSFAPGRGGGADARSITSERHQIRRTTSRAQSEFESEYDVGADGRLQRHGRPMTKEEEHEYWSKKAARWQQRSWEDLAVGEFVFLQNNESIPADVLICATSEEEDTCFIETKNLDGETNLKSRSAVPELAHLRTPDDCAHANMRIDVEPQDTNMYRLNASIVITDRFGNDGQPLRCPVTLNQILLRGCNLRNTKWVIGVVLMTGADTKIIANSGNTPSKRSKVERLMNPMVYVNLSILAIICIACAIADSVLEIRYTADGAYWQVGAIYSDDNPRINGLVTFGNGLITFQNIVPISLYISIEFVRTIQAYFIFDDYDIFYEKTERRTTARSWNLSDDLGQIEYIFSDKTGTLTQNLMVFREFHVGGETYSGDPDSGQSTNVSGEKNPAFAQAAEKEAVMELHGKESDSGSSSGSATAKNSSNGKKRVAPAKDVLPFRDAKLVEALKDPHTAHAKQLGAFFRCLALCHTALTEHDDEGRVVYKAQSPDEQALVQAAAEAGFVFLGKDRTTLRLQVPESNEPELYELINVIEFSSARKRMSVIVRRIADDQILLLAKGADSVIFERSAPGQDDLKDRTDDALEEFANKGLRTLCLGYKELSRDAYETWAQEYHEASVALERREERMEELASSLERDYILLGATAIEDRLQEGVPETIADLKRAGINIWVATGDKLETAIAIGYSTMLLSKQMNLIVVRGGGYGEPNSAYEQLRKAVDRFFGGEQTLNEMEHQPPGHSAEPERPEIRRGRNSTVSQASLVGEDNGQRPGGYALVIDGTALGHALAEDFSRDLLLRVSTQCKAVICCRVSPLQKALIVRLIKDNLGVMTLAIGDGANDVSMIQVSNRSWLDAWPYAHPLISTQAAHVGVGIAGEEGLQAVNSSDYAIAQFRFLKRLLLVHGHWAFYRNGTMIVNFFYKEVINIGYLFWFQIYCAWSTTQALDYVYLLFWNAFWTVAAVIGVGIFDRNISDRVLMEVPELYRRGREGKYFGLPLFLIYMFDGLVQSAVLYFFWSYTYDTTTAREDGYSIGLYEWSTGLAIASVLVANLFTGLDTRAWTWWIVFAVFIGPVLIFVFAPIYAAFKPNQIWTYSWGNNHYLYGSAYFWFTGICTVIVSLLPRLIWKMYRTSYYPTDIDILRYVQKVDNNHDFIRDPYMPARRAAEQYGMPLPPSGYGQQAQEAGATDMAEMHPLQPVQSRASSTHFDMLTGEERPNRGYNFSAEDASTTKQRRRHSIRDRLLPGTIKRKLAKRDQKRLSTVQQQHEEDEGDWAERDLLPPPEESELTPDSAALSASTSKVATPSYAIPTIPETHGSERDVADLTAAAPHQARVSHEGHTHAPLTNSSPSTATGFGYGRSGSIHSKAYTSDMSAYASAVEDNDFTDAASSQPHSREPSHRSH